MARLLKSVARNRQAPKSQLLASLLPQRDEPLLAEILEGVRSVGTAKTVLTYGVQRQRGTAALQASTDHFHHKG
jgi:hypothetical protein